jgi:hypothetical protein
MYWGDLWVVAVQDKVGYVGGERVVVKWLKRSSYEARYVDESKCPNCR